VGDGLLADNPCSINGAMTTARQRQPIILTVDEVAMLADVMPQRFRALVLICAWCGLRWGEGSSCAARTSAWTPACSPWPVELSIAAACHISTPKSGKPRVVMVPPHIRDDIETHLDTYVGPGDDVLLFHPVQTGCHLNDKTFKSHFTRALKSIGREGVRVHDLRHFAGTQTARVGSLVESMARLGHSTVSASLLYQQRVSGRDAEIAQALSRLAEEPGERPAAL
jgi:integrase